MTEKILYLCLIMAMFNFSCTEEETVTIATPPEEKGVYLKPSEFTACECTAVAGAEGFEADFIKAEIDGVPVCFDVDAGFSGSFGNMLKYGLLTSPARSGYYDNLHMIRNAKNSHWQIAIFLENSHALSKTYPYHLPRPNPEYCEIGEIQLNDRLNYTSCTFCPENKYNYYARFFGSGMKMTATSFKNNVFRGVFSGTMKTGNGKSVTINNGEFRIRLVLEHTDLKFN